MNYLFDRRCVNGNRPFNFTNINISCIDLNTDWESISNIRVSRETPRIILTNQAIMIIIIHSHVWVE